MATKTEKDLIAALKSDYLEIAEAHFLEQPSHWLKGAESPIERVLGTALWVIFNDAPECEVRFNLKMPTKEWFDTPSPHGTIWLAPQVEIGEYRADFAVLYRDGSGAELGLVLECDGHDFHERTKEQARRDKRRDRYMTNRGLRVLRFTGSEIWADPLSVAIEVEESIAKAIEQIT